MTPATLAAAVLGLGLFMLPAVAHAQSPAPAADTALAEGRRLYDLKEWDKAIAKFKEAYTLRDDAPALFNIAQSYRLKGDCANALSFYKTFKKKFSKEKVIAKVEAFIVEMEECAKNPPPPTTIPPPIEPTPTTVTPTTTTTTTVTPTTAPSSGQSVGGTSGLRIGSYAAFGVAAVGIGAGIYFAVRASKKASDAESVSDDNPVWDPSIETAGKNAQRNARISFAVGGVAAVGGVVMFVLSRKPAGEQQPVAVIPDANGASLVWSGSF